MKRSILLLVLTLGPACAPRGADGIPQPTPSTPVVLSNDGRRQIQVCVVEEGGMRGVPVQYDATTGDSTYRGRPFSETFRNSARHAEEATWYIENEPIPVLGVRYIKFGLPRAMPAGSLGRIGEYRGVGIYREVATSESPPAILYVPVHPNCVFQTYQYEPIGRAVRGR